MSTFSENLKKARKAKGWSQEQSAQLIGCKRSTFGSYLEGRAHPSLPVFARIVNVFGIRDWQGFICNADFDIDHQTIPGPTPSLVEQQYQAADEKTRNLVAQLLSLP